MEENFSEGLQPQPGEVWFVQLPGEMVVDEVYVVSVSEMTCVLRDTLKSYKENRYRKDQVKWIEQSGTGRTA